MKISYTDENGKKQTIDTEEVEILGDDESRPLFSLRLEKDGSLEVGTYIPAKFNDVVKDEALMVEPKSKNRINIHRKDY